MFTHPFRYRFLSAAVALVAVGGTLATGASGHSSPAHGAAAVSGLDKEYLMSSAEGDAFEIKGGKLALKRSNNAKIRSLATTLVKDHTKSLKETKSLAKKLGVKVEGKPSPVEAWEIKYVGQSGNSFDSWYASLEVADHKQDITEATDEKKDGTNSSVRSSAAKELPVLRKHLALSKAALK